MGGLKSFVSLGTFLLADKTHIKRNTKVERNKKQCNGGNMFVYFFGLTCVHVPPTSAIEYFRDGKQCTSVPHHIKCPASRQYNAA